MGATLPDRTDRTTDRRGFTLVEILVILAILAVLAGVLVPVVTNQIRKAETSRVTSDLNGIRTGVEAFVADVKRYPGDVEDLSSAIEGSDADILTNDYPTGLQNSWDGPYIDRVMSDGGTLDTGFGGVIVDSLAVEAHSNLVDYLTILVTEISEDDFGEIDAVVDNGDGAGAGRLRWAAGGEDPDTTKYLAIPIN